MALSCIYEIQNYEDSEIKNEISLLLCCLSEALLTGDQMFRLHR